MTGEIDDPQHLINLILGASKQDIFFSHRIWFFFQSMLFLNDETGRRYK
jgi:hypothetical protein